MQAAQPSSFQKWSCVRGSDKALYLESGDGDADDGGAPMSYKLDYEGQFFFIIIMEKILTPV